MTPDPQALDFIVIGAQKAGTTTLWRHLSQHPGIWTPPMKEEPFFSTLDGADVEAFSKYMERRFSTAADDALLGKASPQYMMGSTQAGVDEIARRIAARLPDVRLVALLRDPVDRALSHYRMSMRRGQERRSPDAAIRAQLEPAGIEAGRREPTETNSYVAYGEYGRALNAYRAHFPADRLLVELTESLDRDPGAMLDRVLAFLSLPPGFRPPRLDARYHRGGVEPLLDPESKASLLEFMEDNVWPKLGGHRERVKQLFGAFMKIWDIAPGDEVTIADDTRARLQSHFARDAEALKELGLEAPWTDSWSRRG